MKKDGNQFVLRSLRSLRGNETCERGNTHRAEYVWAACCADFSRLRHGVRFYHGKHAVAAVAAAVASETRPLRAAVLCWTGFIIQKNTLQKLPVPNYKSRESAEFHDNKISVGAVGRLTDL